MKSASTPGAATPEAKPKTGQGMAPLVLELLRPYRAWLVVVFAAVAYTATRGERDFNSVQQTVATRYEILCEHKVAQEARDLLTRLVTPNTSAF